MSAGYELDPVETITVGAVGEPGARTFYLQARRGDVVVSLLMEKGQVAALAQQLDELLGRLEEEAPSDPTAVDEEAPALSEPVTHEFRVGAMALGYDEDRDLILLQCEEIGSESEEEAEEEAAENILEDAPQGVAARFWGRRTQMQALARRGHEIVAAGRPTCRMCGGPIDPEGHFCPASNGHKKTDGFG